MLESLFVIVIVFLLSLSGAFILFKILKATAIIKNEKFQAGGALAGFLILFITMFQSYESLQKIDETENNLKKTQSDIDFLKKRLEASQINGTVIPIARNTKIVLAVKQTEPDDSGQFRLSANCIDPQVDEIKLFVISENGGYKSKNIFSKEEMQGIQIKTQ